MAKKDVVKTEFDEFIEKINSVHGENALIRLGDRKGKPVPHIPTGIFSLDRDVLGVGGIAKGRIVEVFGPESGGKTTFLATLVGSAQHLEPHKKCAIIDTEHSTDVGWLIKNNVNVDDLIFSQPQSGEEALRLVEDLVKENTFSVIGVDSVANLVPQAELDGEIGDAHVGRLGRLMSQALRKLTGLVSQTDTILVFTNQIRDVIGATGHAPKTNTPGGRALKFYASIRLNVSRMETIKVEGEAQANKVRIYCVKNKLAAPFRETEVELSYDYGFDKLGDVFDTAVRCGIIEQKGAWYSCGPEKWQGKNKARPWVESNVGLILDKIKSVYDNDTTE